MIATRRSHTPVKKGEKLIGTRVIPLVIKKGKDGAGKKAGRACAPLRTAPLPAEKGRGYHTGNEVYSGRIADAFTPVVEKKLAQYGMRMEAHVTLGDGKQEIAEAIRRMKAEGCELILATGGMSVDPDDQTPGAIRESGAEIVLLRSAGAAGSHVLSGLFSGRERRSWDCLAV